MCVWVEMVTISKYVCAFEVVCMCVCVCVRVDTVTPVSDVCDARASACVQGTAVQDVKLLSNF